jgi:hypothetical protein
LWSKGDAIGGTIKEANTKIVLERFDLKRNRWLGKKKMFRSLAEIQLLRNRPKHFEAKVFQLSHVTIIHRNGQIGETTDLFINVQPEGIASAIP